MCSKGNNAVLCNCIPSFDLKSERFTSIRTYHRRSMFPDLLDIAGNKKNCGETMVSPQTYYLRNVRLRSFLIRRPVAAPACS